MEIDLKAVRRAVTTGHNTYISLLKYLPKGHRFYVDLLEDN